MAQQSFINFRELELEGKKVFLRLDLNVPLQDGVILDHNRIEAALPTLQYLLERKAQVVVASHLGRPKTEEDRKNLSLEPIANVLSEKGIDVLLMDTPDSDAPIELLKGLKENQIIMLENLRFSEGETKNSEKLAAKWSRYCDVYINDAFGACHRAHASIEALPRIIPERAFGFLIEKEMKALGQILSDPTPPFMLLTGGSKVSDKISILEDFSEKADAILIGGAMAYTFLLAQGLPVGGSKVEKDKVHTAKDFLKRMESRGKKVYLPVDHIVVDNFNSTDFEVTSSASIPEGKIAVDIGPKTRELYAQALKTAGSIFWNGPMGVYEKKPFHEGSIAMAKALAESPAFTVVGGGDSAAAAIDSGFSGDISHISTGGGASMEYIQGGSLPGLEILKVRRVEVETDEL